MKWHDDSKKFGKLGVTMWTVYNGEIPLAAFFTNEEAEAFKRAIDYRLEIASSIHFGAWQEWCDGAGNTTWPE